MGDIKELANLAIKGEWLKAATLFNFLNIIVMGYCVIKIFFANLKRGGILLVQIIIGLCLTAFLQTTLLITGLITWNTS